VQDRVTHPTDFILAPMALLLLPTEVIYHILTFIALGNTVEPPANRFESISACTTVCKTLSLAARPYLFKNIRLWSEQHVSVLLDLIAVDSRIASWIKEVTISEQSEADDDVPMRLVVKQSVAAWLGLASKGGELMSRLQNVHTLWLEDVSMNLYDDDLAEAAVWKHLRGLQSLSRLVLERCQISSRDQFIDLLTEAFPLLNDVSSLSTFVITPGLPPDEPPMFDLPHLHTLRVSGTFGHSLWPLINRLRCANLTSLVLESVPSMPDISFDYPALLLRHATFLEKLVFEEFTYWELDRKTIDLSHNSHLQFLGFCNVCKISETTWITETISSLASPVRMREIQITSQLEAMPRPFWSALDAVLSSASKFKPNTGKERNLILNNMSSKGPLDPLHDKTVQEFLPVTCGLDWFRITSASFTLEDPFRRRHLPIEQIRTACFHPISSPSDTDEEDNV
jgi:hypothetical protein